MNEYISKWTLPRLIQLVIGFFFLQSFFEGGEMFGLLFGGFMLAQAVLNIGCFSSKGCSTSYTDKNTDMDLNDLEVEYEVLSD